MKICICGGGNLGHVCAGFLAADPNNDVRILTRHPDLWNEKIVVLDPSLQSYSGPIHVSSKPDEVIVDAEIVLLCLPGFSIAEVLRLIKNFLPQDCAVGSVVSSTGFFFQAFSILNETTPLFGMQRVPFIARIEKYGDSARLLGYKTSLNIAVERCKNSEYWRNTIEQLFKCPTYLMNNYLEVSLTNSNPILHTCRLFALWKNYTHGTFYKIQPLFYREWDIESTNLLLDMDDEFQKILSALPIRKNVIPTLLQYYESYDAPSLTTKLQSIKAFQDILSPMVKTEHGWIPDFKSRYFIEDFPFGLSFILDIAHKTNIECPLLETVYKWGMRYANNNFVP